MKLTLACLLALIATTAYATPAAKSATPERIVLPMDRPMGIAAVVNEDVITSQDVEDRALLVMALTGVGANERDRAALVSKTLSMLIDESLQMQEAKRNGVSVTDKEVDDAFLTMEKTRGRPPGSLLQFVAASNLSEPSLRAQFKAELAWHKTVLKKLRRQIAISDAEVTRAQQTAMNPRMRQQVQIAAIAVPVRTPEDEAKAAALARELADKLTKGASFDALGATLSGSKDARPIPALWLDEEQLEPPVAQALRALAPGDTTQPLRSLNTYQIIKLLARREIAPVSPKTEVAVKQMQLRLAANAPAKEVDALMSIAKSVQENPGTCGEPGIAGVSDFTGMDIKVNYLRTTVGAMSPEMRGLVLPLGVGETTAPYATKDGLELLMLCEKIEAPYMAPDAKDVRDKLMGERAELEAEKLLRNLKRDAFIDIRSGEKK